MIESATLLRDAVVRSYRPYIERRFNERGWEIGSGVDSAIDDGEEWLTDLLTYHLGLDFSQQQRGPLELLQEAMRFPTAALSELGFPPLDRDAVAESAIPGDVYDLAPASSADLGDEAWQAHLSWGAAKAVAMRQAD